MEKWFYLDIFSRCTLRALISNTSRHGRAAISQRSSYLGAPFCTTEVIAHGRTHKFFQLTLYSQRFFIVGPRPVALHGVDVRSGPGAGPSPKPEAARPFTNRHPLPLAPRPGPGSGVPQEASQGVRGHLEKNKEFVCEISFSICLHLFGSGVRPGLTKPIRAQTYLTAGAKIGVARL